MVPLATVRIGAIHTTTPVEGTLRGRDAVERIGPPPLQSFAHLGPWIEYIRKEVYGGLAFSREFVALIWVSHASSP